MRPNSSNSGLRSCSSKPRGICPTKSLMASWSFMGAAGPGFSPLKPTPLSAVLKPKRRTGPVGRADPPGATAISLPSPPSLPPVPLSPPRREGAGPGRRERERRTGSGVPGGGVVKRWGRLKRGGDGAGRPRLSWRNAGSGLRSSTGALWAPAQAFLEPSPKLQTRDW